VHSHLLLFLLFFLLFTFFWVHVCQTNSGNLSFWSFRNVCFCLSTFISFSWFCHSFLSSKYFPPFDFLHNF
jgi:hypothetical protein